MRWSLLILKYDICWILVPTILRSRVSRKRKRRYRRLACRRHSNASGIWRLATGRTYNTTSGKPSTHLCIVCMYTTYGLVRDPGLDERGLEIHFNYCATFVFKIFFTIFFYFFLLILIYFIHTYSIFFFFLDFFPFKFISCLHISSHTFSVLFNLGGGW